MYSGVGPQFVPVESKQDEAGEQYQGAGEDQAYCHSGASSNDERNRHALRAHRDAPAATKLFEGFGHRSCMRRAVEIEQARRVRPVFGRLGIPNLGAECLEPRVQADAEGARGVRVAGDLAADGVVGELAAPDEARTGHGRRDCQIGDFGDLFKADTRLGEDCFALFHLADQLAYGRLE